MFMIGESSTYVRSSQHLSVVSVAHTGPCLPFVYTEFCRRQPFHFNVV